MGPTMWGLLASGAWRRTGTGDNARRKPRASLDHEVSNANTSKCTFSQAKSSYTQSIPNASLPHVLYQLSEQNDGTLPPRRVGSPTRAARFLFSAVETTWWRCGNGLPVASTER
jgi:hypothetical protein